VSASEKFNSLLERRSTAMPRWLRDKMTWLVILAAIAAASSSYSAYKIYLMTDAKTPVTKAKR